MNIALVQEWGQAVTVRANGPKDRIDDDRFEAMTRMLLHGAQRTADTHGIVWTDGPHVTECPPHLPLAPGAPTPRDVYEEYDEDGVGIGTPTGTVYEWTYGWRACGYKVEA